MFDAQLIDRIGWTLIHTLWQLTLVAASVGFLCRVLQRSANGRYVVGCVGMLAAAAAPIITFALLPTGTQTRMDVRAVAAIEPLNVPSKPSESPDRLDPPVPLFPNSNSNQQARNQVERLDGPRAASSERTGLTGAPRRDANKNDSWIEQSIAAVHPYLPRLVIAWLVGVSLLACRPLFGLYVVRQLRRAGRSAASAEVVAMVRRLSERMGIRCTLEVAQSTIIDVPAVVGSLRPLLLLPASALSGLTTRELESIIAHELAHVRRHDYAVNLLQTVIETVLFFHPAVWWMSIQLRQERENCCDDMALGVCREREIYVRALLAMEGLRGSPPPLVAADGGSLLQRVRRITKPDDNRRSQSPWLGGAAVLVMVCFCGWMLLSDGIIQNVSRARADDTKATEEKPPVRERNGDHNRPPNGDKDGDKNDSDADMNDLIAQLDSIEQATRTAAAAKLRTNYSLPSRKRWDDLLAKTKPGDAKKEILSRFGIDESDLMLGMGTGPYHMQEYWLDDRSALSGWFYNKDDTLKEAKIVERLRHVWVELPKGTEGFDGVWTTYFVNGQRFREIEYQNGQPHGTSTTFHPNGRKHVVQHYLRGKIDGADTGYFATGEVSYRGFYKDGKQVGVWVHYDKDGSIRSSQDRGGKPRAEEIAILHAAPPPRKAATIARYGGIMPAFDRETASWNSTHIVVVEGGEKIDGEFTVIESWTGDLLRGAKVSIPELAIFEDPDTRKITDWRRPRERVPRTHVTGRKMVMFLVHAGDGKPWLSAMTHSDHRHPIDYSVVWIEGEDAYAIEQPRNPGPNLIVPQVGGVAQLKVDVERLAKLRSRFQQTEAIEDAEKRATGLREFAMSDVWHARHDAFAALGKCGPAAAAVLRGIINDPKLKRHHGDAIKALAEALAKNSGDDLIRLLREETAYWKEQGPKLKVGWWNAGAEQEAVKQRYGRLVATLRSLEKRPNPEAKAMVETLRDFWRSLPQLEDKSGLDEISQYCDRILMKLAEMPKAEDGDGANIVARKAFAVMPGVTGPSGFRVRDLPEDSPPGKLLYADTLPTWRTRRNDTRPYLQVSAGGAVEARPDSEHAGSYAFQLPKKNMEDLKAKMRALVKVYVDQPERLQRPPHEKPPRYSAPTVLVLQLDRKVYSFTWYRSAERPELRELEQFYDELHQLHDVAEMGGYEQIARDRALVDADLKRLHSHASLKAMDPKLLSIANREDVRGGWRWWGGTRFDVWHIDGVLRATVRQEVDRKPFVETIKVTSAVSPASKPLQGIVLDAYSDEPIKSFRLIAGTRRGDGWDSGVYNPQTVRAFGDGEFLYEPAWAKDETFIRIEADGYYPEPLPLKNTTVIVRLLPDAGITPIAVDRAGQPVADAACGLICPDRLGELSAGRLVARYPEGESLAQRWRRPVIVKSDDKGRFTLPRDPGVQMIAVAHPEFGFAVRSNRGGEGPLQLAPWCALSGTAMVNGKPQSGLTIRIALKELGELGDDTYHVTRQTHLKGVLGLTITAETDDQGHWSFDKLPRGEYQVSATESAVNDAAAATQTVRVTQDHRSVVLKIKR